MALVCVWGFVFPLVLATSAPSIDSVLVRRGESVAEVSPPPQGLRILQGLTG